MDLTDKIKKIREQQRLSQAEMARALNLDPAAYFRLEKRGNKMSVEQLIKVAEILGVTAAALLGDELSQGSVSDQETTQLKERNKELEDRLRDKQFIVDANNRGKGEIWNSIHRIILEIAMELKIIVPDYFPQTAEEEAVWNSLYSDWAETKLDQQEKPILVFYAYRLSVDDLVKIYNHIDVTNEHLHDLLTTVAFETNLWEEGLAKQVLRETYYKKIQSIINPKTKSRKKTS